MGLYHARTFIESWGGKLKILSEVDKGTSVVISLPQSPAPEWFVSKLRLSPNDMIIVLDDDASIHQIWNRRFDSINIQSKNVLHFSAPEQFRAWIKSNPALAKAILYLVDYEFLGYRETGLSLIEEFGIGSLSVLVTSRFEEKGILERCQRLKVRMIPKGLAGFVPIEFTAVR